MPTPLRQRAGLLQICLAGVLWGTGGLAVQVIREHGLPDPVTQHTILDRGRFVARVDAAYPELQIALEYESVDERRAAPNGGAQLLGWQRARC